MGPALFFLFNNSTVIIDLIQKLLIIYILLIPCKDFILKNYTVSLYPIYKSMVHFPFKKSINIFIINDFLKVYSINAFFI
ncbi:hypothetical protein CN902_26625 [Priestia megaterium]|nr:hypothetical protein CN902_26625 [Priestia megaterium]